MVGRTLTLKQMENLVKKMGDIEKPWNCPHGRPTMRHVFALEGLEAWVEGDGLSGLEEEPEAVDWGSWVSGINSRQDDLEDGKDQDREGNGGNAVDYGENEDGESGLDSGSDE